MAISDTFKTEVGIALGNSLIDVELEAQDYNFAFDKAKRTHIQRGNNNLDRKFLTLPVVTGQQVYTLTAEDNVDTVVKIIKPKNALSAADPFSAQSIQSFFGNNNMMSNGGDLLVYELGMQMMQTIEHYTARDTQFIFKKRLSELTLLDDVKTSESWMLEVYGDLTDAEYEDILWVRNYTIAECKIILGNAYRKFSSLSAPTGETSLAGSEMIQEGKDEQLALLEAITDFVDGDATGGVIFMG